MFQSFAKYARVTGPVIPPASDTVLLIHMDGGDGGTNFIDDSGKGHIITPIGDPVNDDAFTPFLGQGALQASMLYAQGGANYLSVPDSSDFDLTGDFTIDFWMRNSDALTGSRSFLLMGDFTNGIEIQRLVANLRTSIFINNASAQNVDNVILDDGIWHHIALVRATGNFDFYVDGISVLSWANAASVIPTTITRIGSSSGALTSYGGNMDEFRINNGAALFTADFMPPRAPDGVTDYFGHSVVFDGTNDALRRDGDFTGLVDGKEGTLSFWINFNGGDGNDQVVFNNTGGLFGISRLNTSDVYRIVGFNAAISQILALQTLTTFSVASGWHHILASWDLVNGLGHLYVDNVDDLGPAPTLTDDDIKYVNGDWAVGSQQNLLAKIDADLADFWFDDNFIDLSDPAERAKFINAATLLPVDLGDDGEIPTGTTPILSLNKSTTGGWEDNRGSGGGMTVTGALTDGSEIERGEFIAEAVDNNGVAKLNTTNWTGAPAASKTGHLSMWIYSPVAWFTTGVMFNMQTGGTTTIQVNPSTNGRISFSASGLVGVTTPNDTFLPDTWYNLLISWDGVNDRFEWWVNDQDLGLTPTVNDVELGAISRAGIFSIGNGSNVTAGWQSDLFFDGAKGSCPVPSKSRANADLSAHSVTAGEPVIVSGSSASSQSCRPAIFEGWNIGSSLGPYTASTKSPVFGISFADPVLFSHVAAGSCNRRCGVPRAAISTGLPFASMNFLRSASRAKSRKFAPSKKRSDCPACGFILP